jgi:hypothetical protein
MTWIAQDNFVGETPEGAWVTVQKGQPFPDGHPLVLLDRAGAEAAAKEGRPRTPLFAPMNFGEAAEPPKAPPKAAPSRKGT